MFLPHKVISALPEPLEPDALYAVRVGVGFDLYIADSTGAVAHKLNSDPSSQVVRKAVSQAAHGFAVGDLLYNNAGTWTKALADDPETAGVVGMVSAVTTDTFDLTTSGYVTGLTGLTANTLYYLSTTVAGGMQTTAPETDGHVDKPVFWATSTTAGYFQNYRGIVVGAKGQVVILADVKAYNVNGGTMTSGARRTRELNTIVTGSDFVSLASDRFTLAAGTWLIAWYSCGYLIQRNYTALYNYTDSVDVEIGSPEFANSSGIVTKSSGSALFVADGSDELEIQHQSDTSRSANGFGVNHGISGASNIYTKVVARRIS